MPKTTLSSIFILVNTAYINDSKSDTVTYQKNQIGSLIMHYFYLEKIFHFLTVFLLLFSSEIIRKKKQKTIEYEKLFLLKSF
ncbi:hypothetical protein BpHYR1_050743 [Brachionus plicatilis]|uniref:Uncharacterized protein n=1 Tax=Brachionus plicatilis TaxID=10195 RepID=A0A3M7RII5_BRAPC|nr:hypothetical protein BpHYR1_050743 [Brachionus plicatilis]